VTAFRSSVKIEESSNVTLAIQRNLGLGAYAMQITIDLPDNLSLSETTVRTELAIALFQQKILLLEQAAHLLAMNVEDFYQMLVERGILTAPDDPDDDPDELIFAHLRISLQEVKEGKTIPVSQLWDGIDD
jgi:predicted HTH domain antitoxin